MGWSTLSEKRCYVHVFVAGFHTGFLAWGGGSIDASTKCGNVRGYLSSLTICTDFSITINFSQILEGGGGSQFPPLCMKPCVVFDFTQI